MLRILVPSAALRRPLRPTLGLAMFPWILLVITSICGYALFEVMRWQDTVGKAPFSIISYLWGKQSEGKSVHEQDSLKQDYLRFVGNRALVLLAVVTLILANETFKAFMR